jgi:hypothetical protein
MEPPKYQRKWEALSRAYVRLSDFYKGRIDQLDSFQGPKDFVYSYFHATYSLKEALKEVNGLGGRDGLVETFVLAEPVVALGIDISNTEKHGELKNLKSNKKIGVINTHVHILDPAGRDRTELTIEVGDIKQDCLDLATKNLNAWKKFFNDHNLLGF